MFTIVTQTFLGLILESLGIYLIYYYITGIDAGRSSVLLVISIVLIVLGIFFLLRAGKSDATVVPKPEKITTVTTGEVKTLQKNNDLVRTWKKTMDQRDRLKLLKYAGEDEK